MKEIDDRWCDFLIATAREDANRVRLSVCDCGVDINPQYFEKLFDAFYTTKTHGMGVGLSISRSIIESHQGRQCRCVPGRLRVPGCSDRGAADPSV